MRRSFLATFVLLALSCRHELPAADGLADARTDSPVADRNPAADTVADKNTSVADRKREGPHVDVRILDKSPAKPDAATPCAVACGSKASGTAVSPGMCVCDTASLKFTLCDAAKNTYCPPSWKVCPSATYKSVFGASPPPPHATDAWIDGCVSNNIVYPSVCSNCSDCSALLDTLAFDCIGTTLTLSNPRCAFGIASHSACTGFVPGGQNSAFWRLLRADSTLSRVLCCT